MENNVAGRKPEEPSGALAAKRGRGRPRKWADGRERRAASRQRTREWNERLEELYLALVNAHWEEPDLARACAVAEDEQVVQVLITHFRKRQRQP